MSILHEMEYFLNSENGDVRTAYIKDQGNVDLSTRNIIAFRTYLTSRFNYRRKRA